LIASFTREKVSPMLRYALAATLALHCAPGFAQDLKTVESGKLTWGSSPTFKPFEFMRDGKAQGFDVDSSANV